MSKIVERISQYGSISTELALLSNNELMELVLGGDQLKSGIGGTSASLTIANHPLFVKKIPLTELERQNPFLTENIFHLPSHYQYGIGSAGFGVWRELAAHVMATNWVIAGECQNFPLMYHWRLIPDIRARTRTAEDWEIIEDSVKYWENSKEIRKRLQAIHEASYSIVLFLEYFPETVDKWLNQQLSVGDQDAGVACKLLENELRSVSRFINTKGLLHFDAHFRNLLTDGSHIYFADFGLAISNRFMLSSAEIDFYRKHRNYDRFYTVTHLVNWLITAVAGRDQIEPILQMYALRGSQKAFSSSIEAMLQKYHPIALVMNRFFRELQTRSKKTPFPTDELAKLEHVL